MTAWKRSASVGGLSPQSTITYYQRLIQHHLDEVGDHTYPRIVLVSVTFQQYADWQLAGRWDLIAAAVQKEFEAIAAAGATFAMLTSNTTHKVLPNVKSPIPVLSMFDAVAQAAKAVGIKRIGLTGTKYTMGEAFYREAMEARGLEIDLPTQPDQQIIHDLIFDELVRGIVRPESVEAYDAICARLIQRGSESVLLGCTELGMLAREPGFHQPSLDTAIIHADAAWEVAVGRRQMPLLGV